MQRSMLVFAAAVTSVVSTAGATPVLITSPQTISPGQTTITPTGGGPPVALSDADITVRGTTLTVNGRFTIKSLVVQRSAGNVAGLVTHSDNFSFDYSGGAGTDIVLGTNLNVLGDVTVEGVQSNLVGSAISADFHGFDGGAGPSAGVAAGDAPSGAGHGGAGINGSSGAPGGDCYGSLFQPAEFGSGGGNDTQGNTSAGGRGGGAIRLAVGGTLTVNGTVSANGQDFPMWQAAGGSGGSVWITCATLAGSGGITAKGGRGNAAYAGGGGGGRVAIYYDAGSFAGTFDLSGGTGWTGSGGAGTYFIRKTGERGTVYIDNAGKNTPEGTEFTGTSSVDANLVIRNKGMLSHKHLDQGVHVSFAGDVTVDAGGLIAVDYRGFAAAAGPGAGTSAGDRPSGAGHGGAGYNGSFGVLGGDCYGSVLEPAEFGSGGGNDTQGNASVGGRGGGALRLDVGGTLTINGTISANGENVPAWEAAGGSGGSLWLTCGTLAGNGVITAKGGTGHPAYAGGGGGGRVAIYHGAGTFAGTFDLSGGSGWNGTGGAGTFFIQKTGQRGTLYIDNAGKAGAEGTEFTGEVDLDANMIVRNAGIVSHKHADESVHLILGGDLTVDTGGIISVDYRGYAAAAGPGAGTSAGDRPSGAGHGGAGYDGSSGVLGGDCYGSVLQPAEFGSGGGNDTLGNLSAGGRGGGALRLDVAGAFTNNGSVSANGEDRPLWEAAGGSGGSLWITCGALAGSGSITAKGGAGHVSLSGAGGGGRVALYYDTGSFTGTFDLSGGTGWGGAGGAGTCFLQQTGQRGIVYIDNANKANAEGTEFAGTTSLDTHAIIRNGGMLSHKHAEEAVRLSFAGDVTVDAGGLISADARGYAGGTGPGAGTSGGDRPAGAGHGGVGGNGSGGAPGGVVYGDEQTPVLLGSGGGNDTTGNTSVGGRGGGAIRLDVGGTLTVNGRVSANGGNYPAWEAAGGSGGSLWITCASLAGTGTISTNGGTAKVSTSGGGGGGRLAVYCCDIHMLLTNITSTGGNGWNKGGDGSVYFGSSSMTIFLQPPPYTEYVGGDEVSLVVDAVGNGSLNYQWYREGAPIVNDGRITGAQTDQLNIHPINCGDGGVFYCLVTDSCGSFPTDPALVVVTAPSDYDHSGFVDTDDFTAFVHDFELGVDEADFDKTGFVDTDDFTAFVLAFEAGC